MTNNQPVRLAYNSYDPFGGADLNLPPIIFIHGLTDFKEHWGEIPQVVASATKRKAYAIDSRNHGDSEWSDHFDFDLNVDDLIHFMDTFSISKAILVGHSMGGMTALKTALTRPDRVEKIVVEDMTVQRPRKEIHDVIRKLLAVLRLSTETAPSGLDEAGVKSHIFRYLLANGPKEVVNLENKEEKDAVEMIKLRRSSDGRYHFKANIDVLEKALKKNIDDIYQEPQGTFVGPACFIYGTSSPFLVGEDEPNIKRHFPNATLVAIEGATHDVHPDKPLEFTDALLKFIV